MRWRSVLFLCSLVFIATESMVPALVHASRACGMVRSRANKVVEVRSWGDGIYGGLERARRPNDIKYLPYRGRVRCVRVFFFFYGRHCSETVENHYLAIYVRAGYADRIVIAVASSRSVNRGSRDVLTPALCVLGGVSSYGVRLGGCGECFAKNAGV